MRLLTNRKAPERGGLVQLIDATAFWSPNFYRYVPPRPLEEIEAHIRDIEKDILEMLKDMSIGQPG